MRVLYLADIRLPLPRANGVQTMETCCALARRGHSVTLLVRPDPTSPPRDVLAFYDLPPHPRVIIRRAAVNGPEPCRRLQYLSRAVLDAVRDRRVTDVIFTRDLGAASALLRIPPSARPPLVYESHGFGPVVAEALPRLLSTGRRASARKLRRLARREALVWRRADGYVTITKTLQDEMIDRFGARPALATVPDGTRLDAARRFAPSRMGPSCVVTYAGNLYPWKGVDVLLHALPHVPDARCVIVGGHPAEADRTRLEALSARLSVRDRVTFTGAVSRDRVPPLLSASDLLVMPHAGTHVSEVYASPLKLFEYMAAGKAIVASDFPAVREVLEDGRNALLVAPDDADALALAITRLIRDPALAERLARCAFDEAALYSWDRRAEALDALLDEVIRRSARGWSADLASDANRRAS